MLQQKMRGRKWGCSMPLRYFRTTQEERANCPRPDEWGLRVDYRRRDLPDVRDDVPRHIERSWKRHRKTQYYR